MPNRPIHIGNTVKASHLILTGYGHWLPNDPRGSGSIELRKLGLEPLGPIHLGRKREQPARGELKLFYRDAETALEHPTLWFDDAMRNVIADTIGTVAKEHGYTIWALAVLRNHLHAVIRTHRESSIDMLIAIANGAHAALLERQLVPENHPVWSERPYKVYLKTDAEIRSRIRYVEENPIKERLGQQTWDFVVPY